MTSNQGPPAANQAADQQVNEPSTTQDAAQAAQTQQSHVNLVHQLLDNLSLKARGGQAKYHAFWKTQPVVQNLEEGANGPEGPIDPPKTVADVRQEPYGLPDSFEWCECDMKDDTVVKEVYTLLTNNYVEDDDAMFRFDYSPAFLAWALQPPGYRPQWHIGVRVKANKKLVAFISAIPATMRVKGVAVPMVEINFLCVHKKLRSKRLAPVLIREITRRVNLCDIWQAAYTAGVHIPTPVASCQYWHRSINPKKLISVGFSRLQSRMTLARTIKLYKLPPLPSTPGLRPMRVSDVPQVAELLNTYLAKYKLAPVMNQEEVAHWLLPVPDVVNTFVADQGGRVSDLISFYTLPSTVLGNAEYDSLKAAYMFYTVATSVPIAELMNDALVCARDTEHDVFNALDILENSTILQNLKFGIGDGKLNYYLYNWRVDAELTPREVGLVML